MVRWLVTLSLGVVLLLGLFWSLQTTEKAKVPAAKVDAGSALEQVAWSSFPKPHNGAASLAQWADALRQSGIYYRRNPAKRQVRFGNYLTTMGKMAALTDQLAAQAALGDLDGLLHHLQAHTTLFRSVGSDGKGHVLATGYYEPLLHGARRADNRNRYPIYKRPKDLIEIHIQDFHPDLPKKKLRGRLEGKRLKPYYSRSQIDQYGKLSGRGLELVWVDDSVDLFFLQVQGSGRVALPDGSTMRVGYADANGQPYHSIGKFLIQQGEVAKEDMSLPVLRTWLADHPQRVDEVLNKNPSYVFFKEIKGGPYGNIGVALTAEHAIATDYRIFPRGAPALLVSEEPEFDSAKGPPKAWHPFARLVVNQDTGGAIRGPGRVDLFMGFGERAERIAGEMKQGGGALFFIAPKQLKHAPLAKPEPAKPASLWDRIKAWFGQLNGG
uniref:peptidoglycan lytic exotransglycosylase n=1 Tax=Magnetococcus massalia (strain MO-1) TaxID=451514 RepID=A0A1S7LN14_MAGMO|nr:putative GH102 : related to lytic transglycosylases [Candidatus Magnetococcus massalia]